MLTLRRQPLPEEPRSPEEVAEGLLLEHLTREQARDWKKTRAFNVRGSVGGLYRLSPEAARSGRAVMRADGTGFCAWPVGLHVVGDWALAMLLWLGADEMEILREGCQSPGWYGHSAVTMPDNYNGAL